MQKDAKEDWIFKLRKKLRLESIPQNVRRPVVAVIGATVLLLGVALIFLPGPAFIVIPLGLAVLATEFVWARRLLAKARNLLPKNKTKSSA